MLMQILRQPIAIILYKLPAGELVFNATTWSIINLPTYSSVTGIAERKILNENWWVFYLGYFATPT
jgi:hypothetical protein